MKLEEYVGICACCFKPIKQGEEYRFPSSRTTFHAQCVALYPNGYCITKERQNALKHANTAK